MRKHRISVDIYGPKGSAQTIFDEIIPHVLTELFVFGERPTVAPYIRNHQSQLVHVSHSNHLPLPELRKPHMSIDEALDAGGRKCPVCFDALGTVLIDGYGSVRAAAIEQARLHEIAFPPVMNAVLQSNIQRRGMRLVGQLPLEPRGFEYAFKVLHSEMPSARSFATGFVYVTDKLLDAVEDSLELNFILAHEIAHVEFAWDDSRMETVVTATSDEPRYEERVEEFAADLLSVLTVTGGDPTPDVVARCAPALRKLAFFEGSKPTLTPLPTASHPTFAQRLRAFDVNWMRWLGGDRRFCALDEQGAVLFTVRLVATCLVGLEREEAAAVVLMIERSDVASRDLEIDRKEAGRLAAGGRYLALQGLGEYTFRGTTKDVEDLPFPTYMKPAFHVGFAVLRVPDLPTNAPPEINSENVYGIELRAPGIDRWVFCNEAG